MRSFVSTIMANPPKESDSEPALTSQRRCMAGASPTLRARGFTTPASALFRMKDAYSICKDMYISNGHSILRRPHANQKPWGAYAPPKAARFLSRLIDLRLGRGRLRKAILRRWERRFGPWVDIKMRGVSYRLNIRDNATDRKILAYPGGPDRIEMAALAEHCRGGTFVDIGANTGHYTLQLAKAGAAQVIAVEPNPAALERLRFNVALNGVGDRVKILPIALGHEGTRPLFLHAADLGNASLLRQTGAVPIQSVPLRPLAKILQAQRVARVAGLKIDIEGMEDRALIPFFQRSLRYVWPACIVIETLHSARWEKNIFSLLLSYGYRVLRKTRENAILKLR